MAMRASSDYQALPETPVLELNTGENEREVPLHTVQHTNTNERWNHIGNLDAFFRRIYDYHQRHGFFCCVIEDTFMLLQLAFICFFGTFLVECMDYDAMFANYAYNGTHKVTLSEVIEPVGVCIAHLRWWVVWLLVIGLAVLAVQAIRVFTSFFKYWEMRTFYATALKIPSHELESTTWHEVQLRLMEVQKEHLLCIRRSEISQLDIYHRILRFKNYMVAMVNKDLLPLKIRLPCVGDYVYLSDGLKFNLEVVLFRGPWSPFENNWHLRADFRNESKRFQLAQVLSRQLWWLGLANLLLSPIIFFWQIFYAFCRWAELFRRDPAALGARRWSHYGRLYVRHMNELDHELDARLNRGYRPAKQYLALFTSPLLTILAKNIAFFAGAIFTSLIVMTFLDEDVLAVQHIITIMGVLGIIMSVSRALIPDEHMVFCPELLLKRTLAEVHYMPDSWAGNAHTAKVRGEFASLFQLTPLYILEEVFSPFITPFMLMFPMRSRALEIVDFMRRFTVEVDGVGDVCSLALMDVRQHGNPQWAGDACSSGVSPYDQGEDGKTELSLVHFKMINPEWRGPGQCEDFIRDVHSLARQDAAAAMGGQLQNNPLMTSITSSGHEAAAASLFPLQPVPRWDSDSMSSLRRSQAPQPQARVKGAGVSRTEGPGPGQTSGVLGAVREEEESTRQDTSYHHQGPASLSLLMRGSGTASSRVLSSTFDLATDMSVSTLYLHELHQRRRLQTRPDVYEYHDDQPFGLPPHPDPKGGAELTQIVVDTPGYSTAPGSAFSSATGGTTSGSAVFGATPGNFAFGGAPSGNLASSGEVTYGTIASNGGVTPGNLASSGGGGSGNFASGSGVTSGNVPLGGHLEFSGLERGAGSMEGGEEEELYSADFSLLPEDVTGGRGEKC